MYTSFSQYRQLREGYKVQSGLNALCEALLFSKTPFREFWTEVGFPTLVEGAYSTEEELIGKWANGLVNLHGYILTESGVIVEGDFDFGAPALNNPAYKQQKAAQAKGPGWMSRLGTGIANMFRGKPKPGAGAPGAGGEGGVDPNTAGPDGGADWGGITGPPALNNPAYKAAGGKGLAGGGAGGGDPAAAGGAPGAGGAGGGALNANQQKMIDTALGEIKVKLGGAITNVLQTMKQSGNKVGWQVANHVNQKLDGIIGGFKFKKGEGKFDQGKAWGAAQDQEGGEDYKAALAKMAGGGGAPTVGSMMPKPKDGPGGVQKLMGDPSTQAGMIPVLAQQLGVEPDMVKRLVDAGITDPAMMKQMIAQHKAKGAGGAGGAGGDMSTAGASQPAGGAGVPKQKKEHAKRSKQGDVDLMESLIRGAGKRPSPANPMG